MIRSIVKYPDPILQRPTEKVTEFDDELRALAADMFESMYKAQGIGLAAPQIGLGRRITVIDLSNQKDPAEKLVLVNPEIVHKEGRQTEQEGCLSLPDIHEKVRRCGSASRISTASGRSARARSCWRGLSSTRSIISTAFFSCGGSAP